MTKEELYFDELKREMYELTKANKSQMKVVERFKQQQKEMVKLETVEERESPSSRASRRASMMPNNRKSNIETPRGSDYSPINATFAQRSRYLTQS